MAEIIQLQEKGVLRYMATHVDGVAGLDAKLAKSGKVFYSGAAFLTESQSYNIDISTIKESLVLVFARYNKTTDTSDGWGYTVYEIPKAELNKAGGKGYIFQFSWAGVTAIKYVRLYSDKIVGTDSNKKDNADLWILERLYAN